MIEVYASLLLHSAKQPITEENLKKVLQSVGTEIDETKLKALVASLEGVNIDETLQQAAVVTPVVSTTEKKEEKKEEAEEKKAEEAAAGLSALFG